MSNPTTNFPASIDDLTSLPNPAANTRLSENPNLTHHIQHDIVNDAIRALETKVGVTGSSDTTSLDYKIAQLIASGSGVSKVSQLPTASASTEGKLYYLMLADSPAYNTKPPLSIVATTAHEYRTTLQECWMMREGSGATTTADTSDTSVLSLASNGGTAPTWSNDGSINQPVVAFSASTGLLSGNISPAIGSVFTQAIGFKLSSTNDCMISFITGTNGRSSNAGFGVKNGNFMICEPAYTGYTDLGVPVVAGTDYIMVISSNNGVYSWSLNGSTLTSIGTLSADNQSAVINANNPVQLGGRFVNNGMGGYMVGSIKYYRIWSGVLSQTIINDFVANPYADFKHPASDSVLYLCFKKADGTYDFVRLTNPGAGITNQVFDLIAASNPSGPGTFVLPSSLGSGTFVVSPGESALGVQAAINAAGASVSLSVSVNGSTIYGGDPTTNLATTPANGSCNLATYSGRGPGNLFDGDNTTFGQTSQAGVFPLIWAYDFGVNTTIGSYGLVTFDAYGTPSAFYFQGSTDNSTWVTLDNQPFPALTAGAPENRFYIANPGSYRYYRLVVTGTVVAGQSSELASLNMYAPATQGSYEVTVLAPSGAAGIPSTTTTGWAVARVN